MFQLKLLSPVFLGNDGRDRGKGLKQVDFTKDKGPMIRR